MTARSAFIPLMPTLPPTAPTARLQPDIARGDPVALN